MENDDEYVLIKENDNFVLEKISKIFNNPIKIENKIEIKQEIKINENNYGENTDDENNDDDDDEFYG